MAVLVAEHFGLEVADFGEAEPGALKKVPERFARLHHVFPIRESEERLVVAVCDPTNLDTEHSLSFAAGLPPRFEIGSPSAIEEAIRDGYSRGQSTDKMVETLLNGVEAAKIDAIHVLGEIEPEEIEVREVEDTPVVRLANVILYEAVTRRSSDIHIGPGPGGGVVRFRIDGVLQDYMEMPIPALNRVVSRIKILGDLDITDRLRPQDGRTRIEVNDLHYDLRISTVPTRDSENAVIRILDPRGSKRLQDLKMPSAELGRFRELMSYRNGIVIVTGPTGSGKTTTLYAGIRELATGDVNIMTVEDPVEYELPGVTQIQVETERNVTFASALRAILRQDPDVIFVGEIRDLETAQVAVQASTTGHLVLATLHTNSAVGIISRLGELGLDTFSIESSLRGALAQRLVRNVCPRCHSKVEDDLTAEEEKLSERYGCRPAVRANGCDHCLDTGYRGRLPVSEVFTMDYRLADLVARGRPQMELEHAARQAGMRTMLEAARDHVESGKTTLEEIARVLGQTGEEGNGSADPTLKSEVKEAPIPGGPDLGAIDVSDTSHEDVEAASELDEGSWRPVRIGWEDQGTDRLDEANQVEGEEEEEDESAADEIKEAPVASRSADPPVSDEEEDEEAELPPGLTRHVEEMAGEPPEQDPDLGEPHILVVDDDPQTRRFVRALLEHHDYQVTEARNGNAALGLLKQGVPYSMVLLDLNMPKLGGEEVLSVLKSSAETRDLPVVVLTAANGKHEIEVLEKGADDYVAKPIVPDRLIARIRVALRRGAVERSA